MHISISCIKMGPPRDYSMEPRYNLATKVMSNGVEVIVAGDRSTRPGEPEYLRLLSSTVTRPITLAPHTLSHHMSMLLPAHLQSENDALSSLQPEDSFDTSTLLTTYIYPTKVVRKNEETVTISASTVVTNVWEVDKQGSVPQLDQKITLSSSPVLQTEVHRTVFTFLNTVMDGDQPLVATSKHTVGNTLLVPSMDLEPSEAALPETNTYYATKEFVRTVTDGTNSQVASTTNVITQVVITDPPSIEVFSTDLETVDVTKTYFVTYTYFSTYVEDDETKVSSQVSVSTDIAVEKFTVKNTKISPTASINFESTEKPVAEKLTGDSIDESENAVEPSENSDQIPASSGDIIDEWYEKFKIKPTTELDLTKTRTKTKTTLKHKSKTKNPLKTSPIEPTSSYTTSVVMSSTATPQGATLLPGDQVIVTFGTNQSSMIPVSDPTKKKPKNDTEVHVSDMLSLGALGINSMNVLGPVFNAMADMLKTHQKESLKRRNDTVPVKKTPNTNPILNFVSNLAGGVSSEPKNPTTRGPLYIPVGSFAEDSQLSESEGRISVLPKPERWVQEKWPVPDKNRRTQDNSPIPHLEGGIPISPGQVINTNSDVIIGRPADSGPRPPIFAVKDNIPIDMKPPPEEPHMLTDPIGQFSTSHGVGPRPNDELKPPGRPHHNHHRPSQPPRRPLPSTIPHDSGTYDLNPPPPPPHQPVVPIPIHLNPDEVIENYVNPVHFQLDSLALPNDPTPNIPLEITKVINRPNGQPLLVNIQPSQVAQVVIPHGSSSAVIISEEQPHASKGQVIDDPKPHTEPETVGFIGEEPVIKVDSNVHRPVIADIMKAESVASEISHAHHLQKPKQETTDYDNIGMMPPALVHNHRPHPKEPPFPKKDPNGIYVDISPPGHLPPPQKTHRPPIIPLQPETPTDNSANHQSGVVHDVPLAAQVQLGSGKHDKSPLNEILVTFDGQPQTGGAQVKQDTITPRPVNDFSNDLAPPPPPRIRPSSQKFPVKPNLGEPVEFMRPPPVPSEEMLLVPVGVVTRPHPEHTRPGEVLIGVKPEYDEEDMEAESDDPFQTEDGEEIQESNSRPLLPGQVPEEVEKLHRNHTDPSNIGVGQTLSFGNSEKVDPSEEPETIFGSQMPGNNANFNKQNEAVVSVGSVSQENHEMKILADIENMFGMKVPAQHMDNSTSGNFPSGKPEEVMGMSPPPVNPTRPPRPQRPNVPFKFEMPAQTIPIPIPSNLDNDFPPVRTPDVNKRPIKPEDIFPPKLPDNFIYREYEIGIRKPPKRPYVTSMPIDTPSSTTVRPNNSSVPEYSQDGPSIQQKPVVHERPPVVNMQKPSVKPPTRPPRPVRPIHQRPPLKEGPKNDGPKRGTPPFPFERPDGNFGDKMRPNPPSRPLDRPSKRPSPFEPPRNELPRPTQMRPPPPNRPPWQPPTAFEHQPPSNKPPTTPVTRPPPVRPQPDEPPVKPPSQFERPPPSPIPSEFEQPPPREDRPSGFEPPPNRMEPSPHFENQPAQGHPPSEKPSHPEQKEKLPPPALIRPTVPQTTEKNEIPDQETALNEPVRFEAKPGGKPEDQGGLDKPTTKRPTVRPPQIPIPTRIRPTRPTEEVSSTANIVTMVTSGSTTIFGDLYTDPLVIQPTRIVSSSQGIQFSVDGFSNHPSAPQSVMVVHSTAPISVHTTTLTVTSTTTTVLRPAGQVPITSTVLLTTTLISTLVDKVTETETLVKPTTSTVTQTHTISTTKTALVVPTAVYPPLPGKYPTAKPEILLADPYEKDIVTAGPHDKVVKPEIFVADPREKDVMTISVSSSMNKDNKKKLPALDNESILVVVTDKPSGGKKDPTILHGSIGGIPPIPPVSSTECLPECRATRNELCVKQEGLMKCLCRPGFARMFPDQPCKPTYTYSMQLLLDRMGPDPVNYKQGLHVPGSPKYLRMAEAAKEGLNRMVMQSDLRDIYHGVAISGFKPKDKKTMVDFFVQLSENVEEGKVLGTFRKSLRNTNFSLGGTEMFAARESGNIHIEDFNECVSNKFHDCSEHARCFNLKGTYTCSCKEGFTDISENPLYPGRLCSDMIGCEYCGYHGTCYTRGEQQTCECFQWYSGDRCRVNLKVLLIALVTIGAILLALLIVCIVMTCFKRRSSNSSKANGSSGYLRYRGPPRSLDKRAMIVDTSSESSVENNMPYVAAPMPPPLPQPVLIPVRKPALRQLKRPAPRPQPQPNDPRSLTVMIPRVKYRAPPGAPQSPHLTMSTFSPDKHLNRTATQIATEQKLINYLDGGGQLEGAQGSRPQSQRPSKEEKRIFESKAQPKKESRSFEYEYKTSNMHITDCTSSGERRSKEDRFRRYSDQTPQHRDNSLHHRKYSAGALVSAGYAVSATGGIMHDIEESTIASNTLKSNRSQFTTLNRSGDHKTMSEARSYDETLIQPQTRPLRTTYSGSTSSRLHPDENHTMVERDLGSTFLLPESHLFKPAGDRGSDISNFDSL